MSASKLKYHFGSEISTGNTKFSKLSISELSSRLHKAQQRISSESSTKKLKTSLLSTNMSFKTLANSSTRINIPYVPVNKLTTSLINTSQISKIEAQTTTENSEYISSNPMLSTAPILTEQFRQPLSAKHSSKKLLDLSSSVCSKPSSSISPRSRVTEDPQTRFDSLPLPITPSLAYRNFKYFLSTYEQGEILEYGDIYHLGLQAQKIKTYSASLNHGYDDERGDYLIVINDHIAYRYEIIQVLGKGSFGQVLKVYDNKQKEFLALKIIRNKSRFHKQAETEVKILKLLKEKDSKNHFNIVHIKEYFVFRKHLCITFELLNINLYDLLKSTSFKGINLSLTRRFAYQIVQSLKLLKALKIIHCDLKPENILLKQPNKSGIKLIDFGSSCFHNEKIYSYIQSRFYRAPEIILGLEYTEAIDM